MPTPNCGTATDYEQIVEAKKNNVHGCPLTRTKVRRTCLGRRVSKRHPTPRWRGVSRLSPAIRPSVFLRLNFLPAAVKCSRFTPSLSPLCPLKYSLKIPLSSTQPFPSLSSYSSFPCPDSCFPCRNSVFSILI